MRKATIFYKCDHCRKDKHVTWKTVERDFYENKRMFLCDSCVKKLKAKEIERRFL